MHTDGRNSINTCMIIYSYPILLFQHDDLINTRFTDDGMHKCLDYAKISLRYFKQKYCFWSINQDYYFVTCFMKLQLFPKKTLFTHFKRPYFSNFTRTLHFFPSSQLKCDSFLIKFQSCCYGDTRPLLTLATPHHPYGLVNQITTSYWHSALQNENTLWAFKITRRVLSSALENPSRN